MKKPLEPVDLDALNGVLGGNWFGPTACQMTPEQRRQYAARGPQVGSQQYRECVLNQHCDRRAKGYSFGDAARAARRVCRGEERRPGEPE
jgi:hypothetical protein